MESIKLKNEKYWDATGVYDHTKQKTQDELNEEFDKTIQNMIVISNTEPTDPNVKLWMYQNPDQKIEIPTMEDFRNLRPATDEQVSAAVSDWLEENISGGETIAVDKSLTVEGAAADAKVVGELKSAINTLRPAATDSDVGKALIVKTVQDGKPTEYEYGEAGGGDVTDCAPVIIDTASGAIASFEDGADSMPLKSLTVNIEPVQDLHGYDNPWPAGGGTNIFNPYVYFPDRTGSGLTSVIMNDGTIHITGTATAANRYGTSSPLVIPAGTYTVTGTPQQVTARTAAEGDISSNGVFTSDGVTPISFSVKVTSGTTYDFYEKIQLNTGSTAIAWTPYSNICPISGWTGCNVMRAGSKNLLPMSVEAQTIEGVDYTPNPDSTITVNGTASANSNYYLAGNDTTYIDIGLMPGTYILSGGTSIAYLYVVAQGKQALVDQTGAGITFTIAEGDLFRVFIRVANGRTAANQLVKPMIRLASDTDPTFEAYRGHDTYPITFPSPDPGTVYGGTLDVTNGVLTVTHQAVTLNGSESRWSGWTSGASTNRVQWNTYNDVGVANAIFRSDKLISNTPNETHPAWSVYGSTAAARMFFTVPKSITSLDAWKAWLAENNVTVVYPLANPIQYQLTAEQVTTLLGTNNIWADCGDVTVEYPADTKLYIERINAPTDDDMTADTQIDSGKYFLIGNTLYLSTTVIPAGDTIIPGTNCTKTNLAAALNALNT